MDGAALYDAFRTAVKDTIPKVLTEDAIEKINKFKTVCQNYLATLDNIMGSINNRESIEERIKTIGTLLHDDNNSQQTILVRTHQFEIELNTFLGRAVPITNVIVDVKRSDRGDINILSEEQAFSLYQNAYIKGQSSGGLNTSFLTNKGKSYAGQFLQQQKKKLQEDINNRVRNMREIFIQGQYRWIRSGDMDYAKQEGEEIPDIYYIINNRMQKGWGPRLGSIKTKPSSGAKYSSGGELGEAWVDFIVNKLTKNDDNVEIGHFDSQTYDPMAESYMKKFANYTGYDNVPGAFRGDIQVTGSDIQLAVKQGPSFNPAAVATFIAIAFSFLYAPVDEWLDPSVLRNQLQNYLGNKENNIKEAYKVIAALVKTDIKNQNFEFLAELKLT